MEPRSSSLGSQEPATCPFLSQILVSAQQHSSTESRGFVRSLYRHLVVKVRKRGSSPPYPHQSSFLDSVNTDGKFSCRLLSSAVVHSYIPFWNFFILPTASFSYRSIAFFFFFFKYYPSRCVWLLCTLLIYYHQNTTKFLLIPSCRTDSY